MNELLTPKQVAQAIGVSESSLKRWCDRGMINTVRTPGGHRRMTAAGVMEFLRNRDQPLVRPELLGLPSNTGKTVRVLERAAEQFHDALAEGDEEIARQVVFDLYLAEHRLGKVFDLVLAPAYHRIGDGWEHQDLEVYQERRAVEIGNRILGELRQVLPAPAADAATALGGTCEGDPYQLSTAMTEVVLRESGWRATNLGASLPFDTLAAALDRHRPRLLWLSVSTLADEEAFVRQYASLFDLAETIGTAVVVGGRALHEPLRRRVRYAAFCDNLQHLESFAASLQGDAPDGKAPRQ